MHHVFSSTPQTHSGSNLKLRSVWGKVTARSRKGLEARLIPFLGAPRVWIWPCSRSQVRWWRGACPPEAAGGALTRRSCCFPDTSLLFFGDLRDFPFVRLCPSLPLTIHRITWAGKKEKAALFSAPLTRVCVYFAKKKKSFGDFCSRSVLITLTEGRQKYRCIIEWWNCSLKNKIN